LNYLGGKRSNKFQELLIAREVMHKLMLILVSVLH